MKERLQKISDRLEQITNFFVAIIFAVMIFACLMQVFTRYVLNNSIFWTEELARFCYIWSTFLAASICTKKRSHAAVSIFFNLLPGQLKTKAAFILQLLVCFGALIMVVYGFKISAMTFSQPSPALSISMGIFYGSVPVGGLLIMIQSAIALIVDPAQQSKEELVL
ncbi:permease [Deltaproteobacteria bacterium]|nr:permease [Deltaproteobacteria bacterium]